MIDSFVAGVVAGYAIAIPIGAIAILILETGLRQGFWAGFAAGSGAATADLVYASVAAFVGSALAILLAPIGALLKWASALFLIGLGMWGLSQAALHSRSKTEAAGEAAPRSAKQTYALLLALTLLNPATIAYFAALILGLNLASDLSAADKLLFVLGAFLASWSWQTLLAFIGAVAHKHLSTTFRNVSSLVGNFMIIGLAIKILM
jgi:arginine exporter protein ArgO